MHAHDDDAHRTGLHLALDRLFSGRVVGIDANDLGAGRDVGPLKVSPDGAGLPVGAGAGGQQGVNGAGAQLGEGLRADVEELLGGRLVVLPHVLPVRVRPRSGQDLVALEVVARLDGVPRLFRVTARPRVEQRRILGHAQVVFALLDRRQRRRHGALAGGRLADVVDREVVVVVGRDGAREAGEGQGGQEGVPQERVHEEHGGLCEDGGGGAMLFDIVKGKEPWD